MYTMERYERQNMVIHVQVQWKRSKTGTAKGLIMRVERDGDDGETFRVRIVK
jgi:hypothetical protein